MENAIITPIKLLSRIDRVFNPGFHVCFSDLVHQYKPYRDFYRARSRKGETVILDYSYKTPRYIDGVGKIVVLKASIEYIKPKAVILPDSDLHLSRTLDAALNTLKFLNYQLGSIPVIGMIQGISEQQLIDCLERYEDLLDKYRIVGFGLPSSMEKIMPRHKFITDIYQPNGLDLPLYIVEIFDSMREIATIQLQQSVGSIDTDIVEAGWSTIPVRLAYSEKKLITEGKIRPAPDPLNYLDEDIPRLILQNIEAYRQIYEGV